MVFVFLRLTSLSMIISRFIHVSSKGIFSYFFYDGVIYVACISHLLYPCIWQWTFKLVPCLGYCKWCLKSNSEKFDASFCINLLGLP